MNLNNQQKFLPRIDKFRINLVNITFEQSPFRRFIQKAEVQKSDKLTNNKCNYDFWSRNENSFRLKSTCSETLRMCALYGRICGLVSCLFVPWSYFFLLESASLYEIYLYKMHSSFSIGSATYFISKKQTWFNLTIKFNFANFFSLSIRKCTENF